MLSLIKISNWYSYKLMHRDLIFVSKISKFGWYLENFVNWYLKIWPFLRYLKICSYWENAKFVLLRKIQNFWFVLPICKESLTSLLHIDSCWVYCVLRSLTSLLYVVHVCRGSFTSLPMHYIICVMWIGAYHPFFM